MSFEIITIEAFDKQAKRLGKKYSSFRNDLVELIQSLQQNPQQGTSIGQHCYKIRMSISAKGKGKSGGARVITCVYVSEETVYLLSIYDKSEYKSISEKELKELIKGL